MGAVLHFKFEETDHKTGEVTRTQNMDIDFVAPMVPTLDVPDGQIAETYNYLAETKSPGELKKGNNFKLQQIKQVG